MSTSVPLVSTGKTVDLVNFLSEQLQPLMKDVMFRVTEWFNPANMIKWLLENKSFNVLVSVKRGSSSTSRVYNCVSLSDNVVFNIEVWMLDDPAYMVKAGRVPNSEVRDRFVEAIQQALRNNPTFGVEMSTKNADYAKHNQHVLNTVITISQLIENKKQN